MFRNQEEGVFRRGFLQNVRLYWLWRSECQIYCRGQYPWVFFCFLGCDTGLYRNPFAKTPFSWFLTCDGCFLLKRCSWGADQVLKWISLTSPWGPTSPDSLRSLLQQLCCHAIAVGWPAHRWTAVLREPKNEHKLFCTTFWAPSPPPPKGSGTSRQNSRNIPGSSLQNPRKTNFRGRAQTFRPPPLRVEDPHPTGRSPDPKSLGNENWTLTFFSQTFRAPLGYPGKIPGYPAKKVWFPWFRGTYRTFQPHPFTWKTPTPPENIRTKKFRFGFLFLAWKLIFVLFFLLESWKSISGEKPTRGGWQRAILQARGMEW